MVLVDGDLCSPNRDYVQILDKRCQVLASVDQSMVLGMSQFDLQNATGKKL